MLQRRRRLNLDHEPLGAEYRREFGLQDLHGDQAVVLEVVREVDGGHAALPELALDAVPVGKGGGEARENVTHGTGASRLSSRNQFCTTKYRLTGAAPGRPLTGAVVV